MNDEPGAGLPAGKEACDGLLRVRDHRRGTVAAVATCRHCGVGLCLEHLAEAQRYRPGGTIFGCPHDLSAAGAPSARSGRGRERTRPRARRAPPMSIAAATVRSPARGGVGARLTREGARASDTGTDRAAAPLAERLLLRRDRGRTAPRAGDGLPASQGAEGSRLGPGQDRWPPHLLLRRPRAARRPTRTRRCTRCARRSN